jgi:hypothetical protein
MQAKSIWKVGGSLVVVAFILFTLFLGILPTYFAIQDLDERTSITEQQIVEQVAYLEKLKALSGNVNELLITVTDRRNLIPDGLEVENLMNEMGEVAKGTKVRILDLNVATPKPFTSPASVRNAPEFRAALNKFSADDLFVSDVGLTLSGSKSSIDSYLRQVMNGPRMFVVYRVSYLAAGTNDPRQVTAQISAQVFVLTT